MGDCPAKAGIPSGIQAVEYKTDENGVRAWIESYEVTMARSNSTSNGPSPEVVRLASGIGAVILFALKIASQHADPSKRNGTPRRINSRKQYRGKKRAYI